MKKLIPLFLLFFLFPLASFASSTTFSPTLVQTIEGVNNSTYSTIHDGATGQAHYAGLNVQNEIYGQYLIMRSCAIFDTSSLNGEVIDSATLDWTVSGGSRTGDGASITAVTYTGSTSCNNNDWNISNWGTTNLGSVLESGSPSLPVDVSLISTSGSTIFGVRSSGDIASNVPSYINDRFSGTSVTLTVLHHTPVVAGVNTLGHYDCSSSFDVYPNCHDAFVWIWDDPISVPYPAGTCVGTAPDVCNFWTGDVARLNHVAYPTTANALVKGSIANPLGYGFGFPQCLSGGNPDVCASSVFYINIYGDYYGQQSGTPNTTLFASIPFYNTGVPDGGYGAYGGSLLTNIASSSPSNYQILATSSDVFFGATGTLMPVDFATGTSRVVMSFRNMGLSNVGASPYLSDQTVTFPVATAGVFSFSTTTTFNSSDLGTYQLDSSIEHSQSFLFGLLSYTVVDFQHTTYFNLSTTTGLATYNNYDTIHKLAGFESTDPADFGKTTNTLGNISSCVAPSILSTFGSTTLTDFVGCLLMPDSAQMQSLGSDFYNKVLTLFPFGYLTRFVSLAYSSPSIIPPPIVYRFGSSSPQFLQSVTASDPITFQVFSSDYFGSSSPLLSIKTDTPDHKNVWQVVNPWVQFVVVVSILIVLFEELMKMSWASGRRNSKADMAGNRQSKPFDDSAFSGRIKQYSTNEFDKGGGKIIN